MVLHNFFESAWMSFSILCETSPASLFMIWKHVRKTKIPVPNLQRCYWKNTTINCVSGQQEFDCQILQNQRNFCGCQRHIVCFTCCQDIFSWFKQMLKYSIKCLSRHQSTLKKKTVSVCEEQKLETSGSFSSRFSQETSSLLFQLIMSNLRVCYLQNECIFNEECRLPALRQMFKYITDAVFSGFNVSIVPKDPKLDSQDDLDPCLLSSKQRVGCYILVLLYACDVE